MIDAPKLTVVPFVLAVWGGAFVVTWRHPGSSQAVLETMGVTALPLLLWFRAHLERHVITEEMADKSETGK